MPQPQPGDLDHDRSQPGIAGLGDALVPMDRSALPRRGGQPGISRNLLSVTERAEQALVWGVRCQAVSAEMAFDLTTAVASGLAGRILASILVSLARCLNSTAALLG